MDYHYNSWMPCNQQSYSPIIPRLTSKGNTMTLTLAERMHNKANSHNTINSCDNATTAVMEALRHFEAEHAKSGLFLDYLD